MWVTLWMGDQRGDLISGIFEAVPVSRRPFFVYIDMKTTQRDMPAKTCETRKEGCQSVRSVTPKESVRRETLEVKTRTQTRWVSIFGCCVRLLHNFLSLRVFGLLSSSLFLFLQCFGQYVLRPSSGVCRTWEPSGNFELRPLLNPQGLPVLIPLTITGYKC